MSTRRESYNPLLKSYPDSERINSVSEGAEVLYLRLIAASDDAGRYPACKKVVLSKLFTHRMLQGMRCATVEKRMNELFKADLIRFYEVGGKRYLQMVDVFKRIRKDVTPNNFCPAPISEPKKFEDASRNDDVTEPERTRNVHVTSTARQPDPTKPDPTKPSAVPAHAACAAEERPCREDRFDDFWKVYPRRSGKERAAKAWQKAIKKADPDVIISAAIEFAGSDAGQAGEFCPYPATWLNGGCWADDREAWKRSGAQVSPTTQHKPRYIHPDSPEAALWTPY